jgi:hypothetical protein
VNASINIPPWPQPKTGNQAANYTVVKRRRPVRLVIVIATCSIWSIVGSFWAMKVFAINIILAATALLLMAGCGRLTLRGLGRAVLPIVAYFGYIFATAFWALNPDLALYHAGLDSLNLLVFGIAYVVALNCPPKISERLLTGSLHICYLVAAIHIVYRPLGEGRWGNGIAMVLSCAIPFLISKAVRQSSWRSISLAVMAMALIFVAQSKTAIIACAVVVPLSLLAHLKNVRRALRMALISALPACALVAGLLSIESIRVSAANTVVRLTGNAIQVGSTELAAEKEDANRTFERTQGVQWFWEYMPWGIGYMNYSVLSSARLHYILSAHNTYLAWGIEGGLPLLAFGGSLFVRFGTRIRRLLRSRTLSNEDRIFAKSCALSIVAVLLFGLAHQVHQYPPLYVLLGLVEGLYRRNVVPRTWQGWT